MKGFGICRCFFEENYFIPRLEMHCTFNSVPSFLLDYKDDVDHLSRSEVQDVLAELVKERSRRKDLVQDLPVVRARIRDQYQVQNPKVFQFNPSYLTTGFKASAELAKKGQVNSDIKAHGHNIFSLPMFSPAFCRTLLDEIEHFTSLDIAYNRPNTMNAYGVPLDDIGFTPLLDTLRENYFQPLCALLYPESGYVLDSHRAFTVKYQSDAITADRGLGLHYDNAELTVNVSLSSDCSEGELVFHGGRQTSPNSQLVGIEHEEGRGILHLGSQLHEALPISDGERVNLIIWMRSSKHRNQVCPMCRRVPTIQPVAEGYGDGFTTSQGS